MADGCPEGATFSQRSLRKSVLVRRQPPLVSVVLVSPREEAARRPTSRRSSLCSSSCHPERGCAEQNAFQPKDLRFTGSWPLIDCPGFRPNPPPSRSSHREHVPAEPLPPADIPNPSKRDTRPAADARSEFPVFLVAAPHGRWWLRWVKYRTVRSRHRARPRCASPVALPERFATPQATSEGPAANPADDASR